MSCVLGGCSPGASASWSLIAPPTVSVTDAVIVDDGRVVDGVYWSRVSLASGTDDVVFTLSRARFGNACTEWAREMDWPQGCLNDYAVEDQPSAIVGAHSDSEVSVASPEGPGENFLVDLETLKGLLDGDVSVVPPGYEWAQFPFVVTVRDGLVVAAHQVWVP
jgi:hypothetical protein